MGSTCAETRQSWDVLGSVPTLHFLHIIKGFSSWNIFWLITVWCNSTVSLVQVAANEYLDRAGISSHVCWLSGHCAPIFWWWPWWPCSPGGRAHILWSKLGHALHAVASRDDADPCGGGLLGLLGVPGTPNFQQWLWSHLRGVCSGYVNDSDNSHVGIPWESLTIRWAWHDKSWLLHLCEDLHGRDGLDHGNWVKILLEPRSLLLLQGPDLKLRSTDFAPLNIFVSANSMSYFQSAVWRLNSS